MITPVARHRPAEILLLGTLASLLGACGPAQISLVWPHSDEEELTFVALVDAGRLLVAHGPYDQKALEHTVLREFQRDGVDLYQVTLVTDALFREVPAFDRARTSELRLELRDGPCGGVLRRAGARVIPLTSALARVEILTGNAFLELAAEASPFVFSVPEDEDTCVGGVAPVFRAFGAEALLLPEPPSGGTDPRRRRWTAPIGPDRLIALDIRGLFVLDRGAAWTGDPRRSWLPDGLRLPGSEISDWRIARAGVDRALSSADRIRLLVRLDGTSPGFGGVASHVIELVWTPLGFEPLRSRLHNETELDGLSVLDDGRILLTGEEGALWVETSTNAALTRLEFDALRGLSFVAPRRLQTPRSPSSYSTLHTGCTLAAHSPVGLSAQR